MATSPAEKFLDPASLAGLMREGTNPRRMVPVQPEEMPPSAAGLPSLRVFQDPAIAGTNTHGYVLGGPHRGEDEIKNRGMAQAVFVAKKDDQPTIAHEAEHLLARQNLGHPTKLNTKFDELTGNKGLRSVFVSEAIKAGPYLQKKYGMESGYFLKEMADFQGSRAKNLLYEQLAELSALEQIHKTDLTKDPELRKTLFKSPEIREAYNAITGLRQTRLDPRDLPPYTRQPEPGMTDKLKKLMGFADGGAVERQTADHRKYL